MSPNTAPSLIEWVKDIGLPVGGFIAGSLTSRWTLTKKDRKDVEQKNFENAAKLIEQHDAAYAEYTKALTAYFEAQNADLDNFVEIATKGDRYFIQLNFLAAAIHSDKVDDSVREQILLPKIRAAVARSLPQHYDALREIADKHGFGYRGELRRTDYSAVYDVVEKHGGGPDWGDNLHA